MAELVHQDVRHDVAEGFFVLGPVIEDRTAIEPDGIGHAAGRGRHALVGHPDTAEEAHEIELGLDAELIER
jgi:hypothetical protein